MLLAELEVCHSRPIAPTRRVALGRKNLPTDPAPGFGGLLLGGIVARFAQDLDHDDIGELLALLFDLSAGTNIAQPRLRHRFQTDRVGLARSVHRLSRSKGNDGSSGGSGGSGGNGGNGNGSGELRLEFTSHKGAPVQHVLGAVYAAGALSPQIRTVVFSTIRRALAWNGEINTEFLEFLAKGASSTYLRSAVQDWAMNDQLGWAMRVLGLDDLAGVASVAGSADVADVADVGDIDKTKIQRGYRDALLTVHPDHGGEVDSAAERIADIALARRILLAKK